MPVLQSFLTTLFILIGLTQISFADTYSKSGKRKIAYAPYQTVSFTHVEPQKLVEARKAASLKAKLVSLSSFSVENLVEQASQGNTAQANKGMLAAGWPGGKAPAGKKAPSSQPTAAPTSQPTSAPSQPIVNSFIYGQIEIDDALKAKVKAGSVLFVIVRRSAPQGQKGMMIAATKIEGITAGGFPLKYVVKQQDAMMGAPLVGKVSVSARIDQDGDAISKQPGDIIGSAEKDVMVGVNPVVIKLNKSL